MTNPLDSQLLESYVPVYETIPDKWEDAKATIVEQLKMLANAINIREIGWYLDEELLSGKAYIPSPNAGTTEDTSSNYRTMLRKVIEFPTLTMGVNKQHHFIDIDSNFTLIELYGAATNAVSPTFTGQPIPNGTDTISYDKDDIIIKVATGWTRAVAVIEYIVEL
jgi:hypothetical protein